MPSVRILLLALVVIAGIAIYIIAFQPNYLPESIAKYHSQVRTQVDKGNAWVSKLIASVKTTQFKPFGEVVHSSELIEVDEDHQKPLPQKAFEYSRYQYCQQVIKEYEQLDAEQDQDNEDTSTPPASPDEE